MCINQRAFMQDSWGGLDLKDLIFPGVFEEECKTHRWDLNIIRKPRGLYVKCHTFFLLQF
jgi:hypothetical protein